MRALGAQCTRRLICLNYKLLQFRIYLRDTDIVDAMMQSLRRPVTCSSGDSSVDMRVRDQETDDAEEPVQRGADHRRAASADDG